MKTKFVINEMYSMEVLSEYQKNGWKVETYEEGEERLVIFIDREVQANVGDWIRFQDRIFLVDDKEINLDDNFIEYDLR